MTEAAVTLAAGEARLAIARRGAEATAWSVGGVELLWPSDPAIWSQISPILYPVVGWTRDGARVGGRHYPLRLHGFASGEDFSVETAGGEQFLGAGHAQFLAEFRTQHVLAAIAARQREVGGPVISTARQIGNQQGVFIVGMGGDVKHAAHFAKGAQLLKNGRRGKRFGPGN